MALNFVPRKVAKSKATTSPTGTVHTPNTSQPRVNDDIKGKDKASLRTESQNKQQYSDEDVCTVMSLAMSDHALWLNSEVRRRMVESISGGSEGFISFSFFLNNTPLLRGLLTSPIPETAMIKSLRSRESNLDVRMMFVKPEWHAWGKVKDQRDVGMYEIRRKDWQTLLPQLETCNREYWERRTVYMENLPVQCKSAVTISRFAASLLSSLSSPLAEPSSSTQSDLPMLSPAIQAVTLPPHHLDKPGDEPKCKGFAFVTLASIEDVELLEKWPWERIANDSSAIPTNLPEAHKFGFRCLSKSRWEALKEEYLDYRNRLVQELVEYEDQQKQQNQHSGNDEPYGSERGPVHGYALITDAAVPSLSMRSPFPPSCLVFVRNIHPQTNKTTLKSLFTNLFSPNAPHSGAQAIGLDYVDYNKGMDCCYLRLSTPGYANVLVEHFAANKVAQRSGLDDCGSPVPSKPEADRSHITTELVLGRREELYWEKVPLKVRTVAVEKCINDTGATPAGTTVTNTCGRTGEKDADGPGRKRKRRR
ncbi:hypothetical protein V5O48_000526 [Marasmius crinis-equi]|uniref:XRRM domain-containing protein n=1 Tax=Marasmius crinis-equi TaxID=585013 RepID=A0ABR3G109_9AGAR